MRCSNHQGLNHSRFLFLKTPGFPFLSVTIGVLQPYYLSLAKFHNNVNIHQMLLLNTLTKPIV